MMTFVAIEPPRIYPAMRFHDAEKMIAWLVEAFGFSVHAKHMDGNGQLVHAQLSLGSSMIMCGQARDDAYGRLVGEPDGRGGKSISVAVNDVDALFTRAKKAGAAIIEEPTNRHYGNREFLCRDPEGNVWSFGSYWPKAHEQAE
jgi:uncharacterized glyoxalase superfamily protein PhnB